jgi:hypothetical protein
VILRALAGVLLVAVAAFPVTADEISPEAKAREAKLLAKASPAVKTWVRDEGRRLAKSGNVDEAAAQAAVRSRFGSLGAAGDGDIMALAFLVMMEAAKSAREDLKSIMDGVKKLNAEKQQQRAGLAKAQQAKTSEYPASNTIAATRDTAVRDAMKDKRDSLSELGQEQQLRMQQAMDRLNKANQAASNLMKKFSDTQSSIIGNLK